jgi:TonB family protein
MLVRFGSYLVPSLLVHCAFFAALASAPTTVESNSSVHAVEYIVITDEGGGRPGDDAQIGDAVEPTAPPERQFRKVPPKPKRAQQAPSRERPRKSPTREEPDHGVGVQAERVARDTDQVGSAVSHSMVMGSAGGDPNVTASGSGEGAEGIDRRAALRAWLREIQREVNKIATRNYPSSAVRMRLEGKLRLGITIGDDGRVMGVRVLSSSGHTVLDDSAAESVMALNIPAPPRELRWSEREISLPIRYALQ